MNLCFCDHVDPFGQFVRLTLSTIYRATGIQIVGMARNRPTALSTATLVQIYHAVLAHAYSTSRLVVYVAAYHRYNVA